MQISRMFAEGSASKTAQVAKAQDALVLFARQAEIQESQLALMDAIEDVMVGAELELYLRKCAGRSLG